MVEIFRIEILRVEVFLIPKQIYAKNSYGFDRNSKGGGLLFYVRKGITSKIPTYSSNCDLEILLVEINRKKRKWLLKGSYNPNKSQISHHLECLNSLLDEHSKKYENYVFIDDFNVNTFHSSLKEFYSLNEPKNLINELTCYKNSEKPTYIDLIQINLHYFNVVLFLRLDCLTSIYSQLPNLK